MLRPPLALLVAALGLSATEARADKGELYLMAEFAPSLVTLQDALDNQSQASRFALGGGLRLLYGLSDTFHLGLAFDALGASNFAYPGKSYTLSDGSRPSGTFYENLFGLGAAVVLAYRVDTGYAFAPVFRVEVGGAFRRYSGLAFYPAGTGLTFGFPSASEFVPTARGGIDFQYRFGDHVVGSIGLSATRNINSLTSWQFAVPLDVGIVW